ncbi:MAG: PilN domain-containing protein [Armatimonadetes bacterium]|nr:PilN domain-containing protein [Armatimonadota bacterium]
MKPFNLAENRIMERNYCQAQIKKRLCNITAMVVLTAVIAGGCIVCKSVFAGKMQETKSKLVVAQERVLQAKQEMQLVNTHLTERKWQGQLAAESKRWLNVLESAIGSMPADVWLDSIKNSEKESSLVVIGQASSFDSITVLVSALKSRPEFGEVRLESVKTERRNGISWVSFTLMLALDQPGDIDAESDTTTPQPQQSDKVPEVAEVG